MPHHCVLHHLTQPLCVVCCAIGSCRKWTSIATDFLQMAHHCLLHHSTQPLCVVCCTIGSCRKCTSIATDFLQMAHHCLLHHSTQPLCVVCCSIGPCRKCTSTATDFLQMAHHCLLQFAAPFNPAVVCCVLLHWFLQKVDIFAKDFLLILIHDTLHWSLAVVCHPGAIRGRGGDDTSPCILHLDSMEGGA